MSFGLIAFTNRGRALQAKAQAGAQLNFTRLAVGDGQLSGQAIADLTALIHEIKSITLNKFKVLTGGKAVVGGVLSNQDIDTGFWLREIGLFAEDPDLGEILYCYGNAGELAEYIPSPGGAEILEKQLDIVSIVGNASNVSATIDQSMVYETPSGAQEKVDAAVTAHEEKADPHEQYALDADLAALEEEVGGIADELASHKADIASQIVGKGADMIALPDPNNHFASTNVRGALEELFTSVSSGKTQLETAITDMGGLVSKAGSIATFDELDGGIRTIAGLEIVSHQSGEVSFDSWTRDKNISISEVAPESCIVLVSAIPTGDANAFDHILFRGAVTSATNLNITRADARIQTSDATVRYNVIELKGFKSLQTLSVTSSLTQYDKAITSVNPAKCIIFMSYTRNSSDTRAYNALLSCYLTTATNLRFKQRTAIEFTANVYVLELK